MLLVLSSAASTHICLKMAPKCKIELNVKISTYLTYKHEHMSWPAPSVVEQTTVWTSAQLMSAYRLDS